MQKYEMQVKNKIEEIAELSIPLEVQGVLTLPKETHYIEMWASRTLESAVRIPQTVLEHDTKVHLSGDYFIECTTDVHGNKIVKLTALKFLVRFRELENQD